MQLKLGEVRLKYRQAPEPTVLQCYSASKECADLLRKKASFREEYLLLIQSTIQA